jgi:lipopolysaccharide export system protein LptC
VTTSSGYRLETAEMAAKLDRTGLESRAPVTATGPAGDIQADRMVLRQDDQTPGAYVLVFNGGVRLVYQPGGQ